MIRIVEHVTHNRCKILEYYDPVYLIKITVNTLLSLRANEILPSTCIMKSFYFVYIKTRATNRALASARPEIIIKSG